MAPNYACAGPEPPLAEVLAEPIVHALMCRDGWTTERLLALVAAARNRHGAAPTGAAVPQSRGAPAPAESS